MSTQSKFTPGPWEIDRSGKYYKPCIRKNGVIIAHLADNSAGCVNPAAFAEEDPANAHLIATAPEMYEALRDARLCLIYEFGTSVYETNFPKIDAAIAKAEGRSL